MTHAAQPSRTPLVPTLLLAVALELVVHRIVLQFLKPEVLQPETELFRLFNEGIGPVVFFFGSFLALACCAWLLVEVILDEGLFPVPWRIVLGLFSCVFLPVATVGCLVSTAGLKAPSRSLIELHPYLNAFFVLMIGVVGSGILRRRGPLLPRAGVVLWIVPLLLFAYFSYRTSHIADEPTINRSFFRQLREASEVPIYGRLFLSLVGFWAFVCFYPLVGLVDQDGAESSPWELLQSRLRLYGRAFYEIGPLSVALGAGLIFGIFVKLRYETAVRVIEAALAYNLPAPSAQGLIILASLTLFALTVAGLAWRPGPTRTAAAGLVALAVAGFRLAQPLHDLRLAAPLYYLLAVVGLIALCRGIAGAWDRAQESALAVASPAVPESQWRRLLDVLAAKLRVRAEDRAAIVVEQEDGDEVSRVEGRWRGAELSVRLGRRNGRLLSLTIVVGSELEERADWTAALAERAGPEAGDEGPERRLEIHDRAQLSDRLLRESVAERLRQIMRGRVDVWNGIGLRYRAVSRWSVDLSEVIPLEQLVDEEAGGEDLPLGRLLALCDLLYDLAYNASVPGARPPTEP